MGIQLGSNFDVNAALPLDSRFQVADLTARDAIIAGKRYEGLIVYVVSNSTVYHLSGGILDANWAPLGGGGAGSLDTFYTETFEVNDHTILTSGNNASFDNGGAIVGTLASDTVSPISGTRSITYTQAAGSLNDWVASESIALDPKQQNNNAALRISYSSTGDEDDIKLIAWDVTNSKQLNSKTTYFLAPNGVEQRETRFFIRDTTANIKWGFQVAVENIGAILEVVDIELSLNSNYVQTGFSANLTDWVDDGPITITGTGSNPTKGTTSVDAAWWMQVGPNMHIRYEYKQTGAGSGGSGGFLYTIPNGESADLNLIEEYGTAPGNQSINHVTNVIGHGLATRAGGGRNIVTEAYLYDSTRIAINGVEDATHGNWGSGYIGVGESTMVMNLYVIVPIEGWSARELTKIAEGPEAENHFAARITSAGAITDQSGDFLGTVVKEAAPNGNYTLTWKAGLFSVAPAVVADAESANYGYDANVDGATSTGCSVHCFNAGGSGVNTAFTINVTRVGADYLSKSKILMEFAPKTMYIDVHATNYQLGVVGTTSYKTVPLLAVSGDTIGTVASNQLSLSAGKHNITLGVGAQDGTGFVDLLIYDITNSTNYEEFLVVAYTLTVASTANWGPVTATIEITTPTVFEFRTKCSVGGGGTQELISRIKVEKI